MAPFNKPPPTNEYVPEAVLEAPPATVAALQPEATFAVPPATVAQ